MFAFGGGEEGQAHKSSHKGKNECSLDKGLEILIFSLAEEEKEPMGFFPDHFLQKPRERKVREMLWLLYEHMGENPH